jgi:MFS family permease
LSADVANAVDGRVARALDLSNFFLADVRDGLGPYLSIYLLLIHHWDQASIGFVMGIGGIAAIVAQTPVGALVDRTSAKRALIVAAALTVTVSTLAMPLLPHFAAISLLQALTGIAASVFAPALAAITLGVVGARRFSRRIGRNESFNHAGNATAGAITGGLAYGFGPTVVFWVLAAMAALSVVTTLWIPGDAIDHDRARGMDHVAGEAHPQPSGFAALLRCRRLLIFGAAMVAFHLANAAMLPLVGQVLALQNKDVGTALMSACVVAAQLVMVPTAYLAGAKADSWGRKRIFLIGFAFLTARGFLYTLSDNPYWLVGVQVRRRRSRDLRCAVSARRAGPHAWHRAFQRQSGRADVGLGCRCRRLEHPRRLDCGRRGLPRGVHRTGNHRRCGVGAVRGGHARNRTQSDAKNRVTPGRRPPPNGGGESLDNVTGA